MLEAPYSVRAYYYISGKTKLVHVKRKGGAFSTSSTSTLSLSLDFFFAEANDKSKESQ